MVNVCEIKYSTIRHDKSDGPPCAVTDIVRHEQKQTRTSQESIDVQGVLIERGFKDVKRSSKVATISKLTQNVMNKEFHITLWPERLLALERYSKVQVMLW